MSRIFLVDLEAVETRYTGEWKSHLPALLKKAGHHVQVICGPEDIPRATTPGAFLNFGGTNIYKASQVEQVGRLFCNGAVHPGDHFKSHDHGRPVAQVQHPYLPQHTVNSVANPQKLQLWLKVDV